MPTNLVFLVSQVVLGDLRDLCDLRDLRDLRDLQDLWVRLGHLARPVLRKKRGKVKVYIATCRQL